MTNRRPNLDIKIIEGLRSKRIDFNDLAQHEKRSLFVYLQDECRKIVEADTGLSAEVRDGLSEMRSR